MKSLTVTTPEQFDAVDTSLRGWFPGGLTKNIKTLLKLHDKNHKVIFREIDIDSQQWDGEMLIKFSEPPSASLVVNGIVQYAHADEIGMIDETTLRLWWD